MTDKPKLLSELADYKIFLSKSKNSDIKTDMFILELHNKKSASEYRKVILHIQDLPPIAQYLFPTIKDFIAGLQTVFIQKNVKDLVSIDENANMFIKFNTILGKQQFPQLIKLSFLKVENELQKLSDRMDEIQKKISKFLGDKEIEKKNKGVVHYESPLIEQKESKKNQKEIKQSQKNTQKNSQKLDLKSPPMIKYKIEDKKITIEQQNYRVEASLISKDKMMLVSCSVAALSTGVNYTGELTDVQIRQFLYEPTKIKTAKELFQEIRKNAKQSNNDTVKINERQNKLEILIIVPADKDRFMEIGADKQESIFAEIDIKAIKQEEDEDSQNLNNLKSKNDKQKQKGKDLKYRDFNLSSMGSNAPKTSKMVQNIKSTLIKQKASPKDKKDNGKSFDKGDNKQKKTKNIDADEKPESEISFKTKKTVNPQDNKDKNFATNQNSAIDEFEPSADFSLSFTYSKKNSKSRDGFLLNKQHELFFMRYRCAQLKKGSGQKANCALLAKKIHKKNQDFDFHIKIHKITDFLIVGIAAEDVGNENIYTSQYFLGYSPLTDSSYECGSVKQGKVGTQCKDLKQNTLIRVKVNMKNQKISWSLKQLDSKEDWKVLKEHLIPHFMQLKDLFPTVFLRKLNDKVEFILPKNV